LLAKHFSDAKVEVFVIKLGPDASVDKFDICLQILGVQNFPSDLELECFEDSLIVEKA
jgi:hypothetical protein